jgi:hypothetical protein
MSAECQFFANATEEVASTLIWTPLPITGSPEESFQAAMGALDGHILRMLGLPAEAIQSNP